MGDTIDMHDWMDQEDDYPSDEVVCKRCHKTELTWYDIGTKANPQWRLFEFVKGKLKLHECRIDHTNAFEDES